ncbi:MAG: hypothetical protein R2828_20555 [Saprospiraceae bacterium]
MLPDKAQGAIIAELWEQRATQYGDKRDHFIYRYLVAAALGITYWEKKTRKSTTHAVRYAIFIHLAVAGVFHTPLQVFSTCNTSSCISTHKKSNPAFSTIAMQKSPPSLRHHFKPKNDFTHAFTVINT